MTDSSPPLVAILGASGFIGSAVTAALARRPIRLRAVARRPSPLPAESPAAVEVLTADLTVPDNVTRAVAGANAVVHLVAHITGAATWRVADDDHHGERVNLGVLRDVVAALRARAGQGPPPVVVFAGSASQVTRSTSVRLDGSEPEEAATTYGRHKLAAEHALKAATNDGVLRGITLRLPTVFGQGPTSAAPDRGVVATMVRRALAGEPLSMWNDGAVERDLLYVDDAAEAFLAALDHADTLACRHWLLGTGQRIRLVDLFTTIADLVSVHTGRPPVPVVSVPAPPEAAETDFQSYEIDSSAFRAVTGWRPRVSLPRALRSTVAAMAGAMARSL